MPATCVTRPPCAGPMLRYLRALISGTTERPCTWSGGDGCPAAGTGWAAAGWAAAGLNGARSTADSTTAATIRAREVSMWQENTFDGRIRVRSGPDYERLPADRMQV